MNSDDGGAGPGSMNGAGEEATSENVEEGRRPTPVRVVMEGAEEDGAVLGPEARVLHDKERGVEWVVTVSGRSTSGVLPLRTVPLMEVGFSRADDPLADPRQAIVPEADLAQLPDEDLAGFLRVSLPFREPKREVQGSEGKGRGGKGGRTTRS